MSALSSGLARSRVIVCAGAGGVGKTTICAAVGLELAAQGRRVAVVTIDPARRLAEALGMSELRNEPREVDQALLDRAGVELDGELWAMMLDVKRTFDELIERISPSRQASQQILANPIYRHLSTAIAGSQEYTAIAKLFELAGGDEWDAIVLDTPPSRNALDFLEAPGRLRRLLEDRAFSMLLGPPQQMARLASVAFGALRRVTGVALFADLTQFFSLLKDLLESFRRRAADVEALLTDPTTGFVIVTTSERAPLDEAILFAARLDQARMRRLGVIVNRVHSLDTHDESVEDTAARLRSALGPKLASKVARVHADVQALAHRDSAALARLREELGEADPTCICDRERELTDIGGLRGLGDALFR